MGVAAGAGAVGAVGVHQAVKQKQTDRRDAYKRPKAGRGAELLLKLRRATPRIGGRSLRGG